MVTKNRNIVFKQLTTTSTHDTYTVNENEEITVVLLAAEKTEYQVSVNLVGRNAHAIVLGIIVGRGNDQIKINTLQQHTAPQTLSDLHIKSILRDNAFFAYEGFIRIEKQAQQSNAYQRNDNLLLSAGAKAESKPALEILANDVRCTHGATLGKIDPEQLFYLESRGISRENAKLLIIQGFFQMIIDKIDDEKVQTKILSELEKIL